MIPSWNVVTIAGKVMTRPVYGTRGDSPYCTFEIAVTKEYTRKNFEKVRETMLVPIVWFGARRGAIAKDVGVLIQGSLEKQRRSEGPGTPGEFYVMAKKVEPIVLSAVERELVAS